MLKHLNAVKTKPSRVVLLGSRGFVGSHIYLQLQHEAINILGISKDDINLLTDDAEEKLLQSLRPHDTLVIVSSLVPCKTIEMLTNNITMMKIICNVIEKAYSLSHVIYISSDAVYADDISLVSESSKTMPSSLHGMMHICRELMLKHAVNKLPLTILRPTLLYGKSDPHNSYGPNRFARQIEKNQDILLFGDGEEKRNYVFVEDVAKITSLVIQHKSTGILNIATDEASSFKEIANVMINEAKSSCVARSSTRQNPIMHRHFDISGFYKAFPDFRYLSFREGLKNIIRTHQTEIVSI